MKARSDANECLRMNRFAGGKLMRGMHRQPNLFLGAEQDDVGT